MNAKLRFSLRSALVALCAATLVQAQPGPGAPRPNRSPAPKFGDPLPGLDRAQLAAFLAGLAEFENVESPESGLGPLFNNVSCVSCHAVPAPGGSSALFVTRFGRMANGQFDPLTELGGSLLQEFSIHPEARERIPREANVVARRQSTPLFGLGLIEAIPDAAILDNARRPKPDQVRGRIAWVEDVASGVSRVGRFGWKAQQANLLSFAADAYVNEMGITSRLFPHENAPNGNLALLAKYDRFIDPEDVPEEGSDRSDIDAAADFMRLLGPPPTLPATDASRRGEALFTQVGCAACHQPAFVTGPNQVAALDRKPVPLYSDLLLHDMGRLADGIAQGAAGIREMKTAPLWGLRASGPYLHDGRARSIDEAIRAHDGEAQPAREAYTRLTPAQRSQLLEFLNGI